MVRQGFSTGQHSYSWCFVLVLMGFGFGLDWIFTERMLSKQVARLKFKNTICFCLLLFVEDNK